MGDVTTENGIITTRLFAELDYDLLSIGNHELYKSEIAYDTFANFSKFYGEKYLTSNVQIRNNATGEFEDIGHKYRYFTTKKGLRIMAFGVIFDFDRATEVTKVTTTADMVKESWFTDAVNYKEPIDLFVVIGHNPVRTNETSSTFGTLYETIRKARPDVPIQAFGGHTHIRDFVVYDEMSTGLEAGMYCETVGWLAMSGVNSSTYNGTMEPKGVPNPERRAVKVGNSTAPPDAKKGECSEHLYARRYLDWNRLTFAYHAPGSQDAKFDTPLGLEITGNITEARKDYNLTKVFGCVPKTYCAFCKPFGTEGNVYHLLETVLAKTIINEERNDKPRLILVNTGSIRFDIVQGPFTLDDTFIVNPFKNGFEYIPDVPHSQAIQLLDILNDGPIQKREVRTEPSRNSERGLCVDPPFDTQFVELSKREQEHAGAKSLTRRTLDDSTIIPGYVTTDDFGSDGDDTPHSKIPYYEAPNDVQAKAGFPEDGSSPEKVDVVFVDFIGATFVVPALNTIGGKYTAEDIKPYKAFGDSSYLQEYATKYWQENMPNCPVDDGTA